jgi:hypothetical protein
LAAEPPFLEPSVGTGRFEWNRCSGAVGGAMTLRGAFQNVQNVDLQSACEARMPDLIGFQSVAPDAIVTS